MHDYQMSFFGARIIVALAKFLYPKYYKHTANVYRELQGLYREIGVQGFQIDGDCMYTV